MTSSAIKRGLQGNPRTLNGGGQSPPNSSGSTWFGCEYHFWPSYLFVLIASPGIFAEPPSIRCSAPKIPVGLLVSFGGSGITGATYIMSMIIGLFSKVIAKLPLMLRYMMGIPTISVMANDSSNWYDSSCHRLIVLNTGCSTCWNKLYCTRYPLYGCVWKPCIPTHPPPKLQLLTVKFVTNIQIWKVPCVQSTHYTIVYISLCFFHT